MTSAERAKRWRDRRRREDAQVVWQHLATLAGHDDADAVGAAALERLPAGSLRALRSALTRAGAQ